MTYCGTSFAASVVSDVSAHKEPRTLGYRFGDGDGFIILVDDRGARIVADGSKKFILADRDDDHVAWVEQAVQEGRADRGHIGKQLPGRIPNISSIAFGGPDLRHAHLGCFGDHIYRFPCEVPGVPPVHWSYPSIFE